MIAFFSRQITVDSIARLFEGETPSNNLKETFCWPANDGWWRTQANTIQCQFTAADENTGVETITNATGMYWLLV